MNTKNYFIFDVESIGLYGEGFAVAGGVYSHDFRDIKAEFAFHCPSSAAKGSETNRAWVHEHVTISRDSIALESPAEVRKAFCRIWELWAHNSLMFVECGYPVETNFLAHAMKEGFMNRAPYPLHEISTVMACAGMDPMQTWSRLHNELPAHEPLADSRLSARILANALDILNRIITL